MQQSVPARPSAVSRALARDRLGIPAVLAFMMGSIAALTVCAGVIPTAYAATGLTAIPAAFVVVAVLLALFAAGYIAMSRHVRNAGAFYAFIAHGLGRVTGVSAALVALAAYECLQVGLFGALGPAAASEAATYLHVTWPWWAWSVILWTLITVLGLARVELAGRVLAVLTGIEILVTVAETICGLLRPAGGHLDFGALSPSALTSSGMGAAAVLAVIAVLGFVGFEQSCVMAEEARNPRRTIPVATYSALAVIGVLYAAAAWAMAVHAGQDHVVAAAGSQESGLLFGLTSNGALKQSAELLYVTSLFAAGLAYHNVTWRYMFALGREGVLPAVLARTGRNSIPWAASLTQSLSSLLVIVIFAVGGWPPMTGLFFGAGTTGGFGVVILLAVTAAAVIRYFAVVCTRSGEGAWARIIAPGLSVVILGGIVVLAIWRYATLLGVAPGNPARCILPAGYGVVAAIGLAWGLALRSRRPAVYAGIGLGAYAPAAAAAASQGAWS